MRVRDLHFGLVVGRWTVVAVLDGGDAVRLHCSCGTDRTLLTSHWDSESCGCVYRERRQEAHIARCEARAARRQRVE